MSEPISVGRWRHGHTRRRRSAIVLGVLVLATGAVWGTVSSRSEAALPCVQIGWETPEAASAAFANVPGTVANQRWLSGDGGWTIKHPTTCNTLHVFGDSATVDSAGQRKMPHGTALVQTTTGVRWISGNDSMIPDSTDDSIDWPGPLAWDNGRLYSFTSHISTVGRTDNGWTDLGKDLAEFTWNGTNSLQYKGKWVTPSTGRAGTVTKADGTKVYSIAWGASTLQLGGYHYIYGTYQQAGWFGNRVYTARVPVGQLTNAQAWRYHTATGGWSARESDAATVISEYGGPESSFSIGYDAGQVKIVSKKDGSFGTDVQRWASSSPVGPWTVTKVAEVPWVETDQTYLVTAHYDMPRFTGNLVPLTVSHGRGSSGSLGDMWERPERYRNSWAGIAP